MTMSSRTGICPFCGSTIPLRARACPHCGSDERTGWSNQTYLDDIPLPADDEEYNELVENEFGREKDNDNPRHRLPLWIYVTGVIMLVLGALWIVRSIL